MSRKYLLSWAENDLDGNLYEGDEEELDLLPLITVSLEPSDSEIVAICNLEVGDSLSLSGGECMVKRIN